jgi:hypothetical protein
MYRIEIELWFSFESRQCLIANSSHRMLFFNTAALAAIMTAVQRNFGGHPENADAVLQSFFASLNLPQPDAARLLSVATLVEQNLDDVDARHLMVLTKVRGFFMLPKLACFP